MHSTPALKAKPTPSGLRLRWRRLAQESASGAGRRTGKRVKFSVSVSTSFSIRSTTSRAVVYPAVSSRSVRSEESVLSM